jgi:cytochrome c peroxidase
MVVSNNDEIWRIGRRHLSVALCVFLLFGLAISAGIAAVTVAQADDDREMVFPVYNPKPKGIPPVPIPADNPQTPAKVRLGEKLYFDPMLSVDGTVSCASCHSPGFGFADGQPTSDGVNGQLGGRNAPTVYNAAYYETQFWDGRAMSLEDQARGPVQNPIEMANTWDNVVAYLQSDVIYQRMFKQAFGGHVTEDNSVKAIAAYERTVVTWDSPYDRYLAGDIEAMSADQVAGMDLFFGKAQCANCHKAPLFFEDAFGNIGVPQVVDMQHFPNDGEDPALAGYDLGRYYVTHDPDDLGDFKTPGLRNVELTAPYMHNGVFATLEEVVAHYNMVPAPVVGELDPDLPTDLGLTAQEQMQLVEFLKALTGRTYSYMPEDMLSMQIPVLLQMLSRTTD